nr:MAG TPA: hypothetical protein [Caudoviricetes sp.]
MRGLCWHFTAPATQIRNLAAGYELFPFWKWSLCNV